MKIMKAAKWQHRRNQQRPQLAAYRQNSGTRGSWRGGVAASNMAWQQHRRMAAGISVESHLCGDISAKI